MYIFPSRLVRPQRRPVVDVTLPILVVDRCSTQEAVRLVHPTDDVEHPCTTSTPIQNPCSSPIHSLRSVLLPQSQRLWGRTTSWIRAPSPITVLDRAPASMNPPPLLNFFFILDCIYVPFLVHIWMGIGNGARPGSMDEDERK